MLIGVKEVDDFCEKDTGPLYGVGAVSEEVDFSGEVRWVAKRTICDCKETRRQMDEEEWRQL